ncbi:cell division protein ZapA [Vagococcus silagei]|uniref:Cell division protein ZapA n=1 Tax=Vagococcus silagei TaxID=2508885 RepID=A0A4S3B324_9ENTE|nr:cell division protein ZapA [Vagococcus silagei]THB60828.1 hypothetical protein ESZ54_07615 [Vagococcus silagei]
MSEPTKRFKLNIKNEEYIIIGNEEQSHMSMVNDLVNEHLDLLMDHNPTLSKEQAAILLAINTVSLQVKQQEKILDLRTTISELNNKVDILEENNQRLEHLESRLNDLNDREREKTKDIIENNGDISEADLQNQIEIQKLMNQQVKEKIKNKNQQKNKNK